MGQVGYLGCRGRKEHYEARKFQVIASASLSKNCKDKVSCCGMCVARMVATYEIDVETSELRRLWWWYKLFGIAH